MSATRFKVLTRDGREFVGTIMGFGGAVGGDSPRQHKDAFRRVIQAAQNAHEGEPLGSIMELEPGHCRMFADGHDPYGISVPLAGSIVILADDEQIESIRLWEVAA